MFICKPKQMKLYFTLITVLIVFSSLIFLYENCQEKGRLKELRLSTRLSPRNRRNSLSLSPSLTMSLSGFRIINLISIIKA